MKKILVTGASGFIGRNIFERLSKLEDYEVWGTYGSRQFLNHPRLLRVDLTKKEEVQAITRGFDVLIHAAAVTSGAKDIRERPFIHITDNMIMNALLLEAAYAHGIAHTIFLSCTVLYPMNQPTPVKESDFNFDAIHPAYTAAIVKVAAEKLCRFYADLGGTQCTVIRHSNMYGPYDKFDSERAHMMGANIHKVMCASDRDAITIWGNGEERRDLLYISDLVDFIERAINTAAPGCEVFNVGSGMSFSVKEAVECIIRLSRKDLSMRFDTTKPTIPMSLSLDIFKARTQLGWTPKVSLEDGIAKTLEWYTENM